MENSDNNQEINLGVYENSLSDRLNSISDRLYYSTFFNFIPDIIEEAIIEQRILNSVLENSFLNDEKIEINEKIEIPNENIIIFKNIETEFENCLICHDKFEKEDKIANIKCNHIFHYKCLNKWITRSAKCPYCNKNISIIKKKI